MPDAFVHDLFVALAVALGVLSVGLRVWALVAVFLRARRMRKGLAR
jgi:hypothetical protein